MNLTPAATNYAVELHTRVTKTSTSRFDAYYAFTEEEWNARKTFATAMSKLNSLHERNYVAGLFTELVHTLLPIWENEVDHNRTHSFDKWLPIPVYSSRFKLSYPFNGIVQQVYDFFSDLYGCTQEQFNERLSRIEAGLQKNIAFYHVFLQPACYDAVFPVEWLDHYAARAGKFYLPSVITAFNRGFPEPTVRIMNASALVTFTPEELHQLLLKHPIKVVNQLALTTRSERQRLTFELADNMAEAGFTTQTEVKNYARTFGISFTAMDFYTRLIRAKTLYPDLNDYIPEV